MAVNIPTKTYKCLQKSPTLFTRFYSLPSAINWRRYWYVVGFSIELWEKSLPHDLLVSFTFWEKDSLYNKCVGLLNQKVQNFKDAPTFHPQAWFRVISFPQKNFIDEQVAHLLKIVRQHFYLRQRYSQNNILFWGTSPALDGHDVTQAGEGGMTAELWNLCHKPEMHINIRNYWHNC